eukprot:m.20702 g.20702  ORF g.20702 m.20702 type:complete len:404 (+) comp11044_c0_seq2:127-1338(+)
MSEITYASLATLRKSDKPRPPPEESFGAIYSDLQNIFQRPTCEKCGNLVDEHDRMLEQPALAAASAIVLHDGVPSDEHARFDSSLFSIALVYDEAVNTYRLPEAFARTGERLDVCSQRSVEAAFDISLDRVFAVSSHGQEERSAYLGSPTITVMHVLPVNEAFDLPMFNLKSVLKDRQNFHLERDHRDMLYELTTWLKMHVNSGSLRSLFRPSAPYATRRINNPCYLAPQADLLDAPVRSFVNPYFKTGELKPKPGDEMFFRRSMPFVFPNTAVDETDYESSTDPRRSVRQPAPAPNFPGTIEEVDSSNNTPSLRSGRSRRSTRSGTASRPSGEPGVAGPVDVAASEASSTRSAREMSRHSSHEELMRSDFNPLADDFQADFSNPLTNGLVEEGSTDGEEDFE